MPVKYSLKTTILLLVGGLASAAGIAFLANFVLAGPKLGFHYDFLLKQKKTPPAAREIIIIETGEFTDSGDIASVLITLTEMEAENLIFSGKVSPSSSPVIITESEIRSRFIDEYILIGRNIRNLFEAIRSGSVSPVFAPGYVERLVELTEQGRDRLLTALIDRDEDLLRSITVFGNYLDAEKEPVLDWDGKIRRVQPVDINSSVEHPVFRSLKNKYAFSQIETADQKKILWLRGHDGTETDITLDNDYNIITPWNCDFRKIDISLFREYDEAGRSMRSLLTKAGELGAFSRTLPEMSPLFLGDFALNLYDEMLKSQDGDSRHAWINARADYIKSINDFLESSAQMTLVNEYNEVITDEITLSEEGLASLARMRDELISAFSDIREEYKKFLLIHDYLKSELFKSYCIMGNGINTQYSALLANVLVTQNYIKLIFDRDIFYVSLICASSVVFFIFLLNPSLLLVCGLILSILYTAGFSLFFVNTSYWIDPLVVLSSSLAGTFFMFSIKYSIKKKRARQFSAAYGTAVSPKVLKEIIYLGKPLLGDIVTADAAVVAIKDINLLKQEDREKSQEAGKIKMEFYSSVKKIVYSYGGIIAGFEGDTIIACFGSPLDRASYPYYIACEMTRELLKSDKKSWRFGIDTGECSFSWTAETGYSVNGRPGARARVLASKTIHLKVRSLMTECVKEIINKNAKKAGSLYNNSEPVYELV